MWCRTVHSFHFTGEPKMKRINLWARLTRRFAWQQGAGKQRNQRASLLFLENLEDRSLLNAVTYAPGTGWRPLASDPNPYDASTILVDFVSESAAAASVM